MKSPNFEELLNQAGIPITEDAIKAEFQKEVEAQGAIVSNDSKYSPFWRLVTSIVTKPVMWVMHSLLINTVLPSLFVRTAKDQWLELLGWGVNVERKPAVTLLGEMTFVKKAAGGVVVVPAGSVIQTTRINGNVYRLLVSESLTITDGVLEGVAKVQAEQSGAAYNLATGYFSILPVSVPGIERAYNGQDWIKTPGADQEADDAMRLRVKNQFTIAGNFHIDAVYRGMISEFAGVRADNIFFQHGAPRGPGSANAYVLMEIGETPPELITKINDYINQDGNHGHGDDMQAFAMPVINTDITLEVKAEDNVSTEDKAKLKTKVENFIRCAFRENLDYSPTKVRPLSTFSYSRLTQELHREFEQVYSLYFTQRDLVIAMEMPRISTLTVTVD